jgi:glycosyltransferase involved in cell wall biosynthesis
MKFGKIGVGIITYNRPEYYKSVLASIPRDKIDHLVVVNDGDFAYAQKADAENVFCLQKQFGVSKVKNLALKTLLEKECKHLFLIEDDILIKDPNVFNQYIETANFFGIHHLCFEALKRNLDYLVYQTENPEKTLGVDFYFNPEAGFMYMHSNIVSKLGYFDEKYMNAFEHIDFAYNLIDKKVAPPFWYFPDIKDSRKFLSEIEGSTENSTITNKEKYKENWDKSANHFIEKWGVFTNQIPRSSIENLEKSLNYLRKNYQRL